MQRYLPPFSLGRALSSSLPFLDARINYIPRCLSLFGISTIFLAFWLQRGKPFQTLERTGSMIGKALLSQP